MQKQVYILDLGEMLHTVVTVVTTLGLKMDEKIAMNFNYFF